MQTDLSPELPAFDGYETIVKGINVFSRYLFVYPTSSQDKKKSQMSYLTL